MAKQDPLVAKCSADTYLGFDFGSKKIGTAVGQTVTATASPLVTIRSINQNPNWQIISQLIQEWRPIGLVVGISRQSDGTDNPITPRMIKFMDDFRVADILALSGHRHQQVVAHQPLHQFGVTVVQSRSERAHV